MSPRSRRSYCPPAPLLPAAHRPRAGRAGVVRLAVDRLVGAARRQHAVDRARRDEARRGGACRQVAAQVLRQRVALETRQDAAHVVGGYRPQAPAQPRRDTYNGDLPFVRNQNDRNAGKRIFWFVQSGGAWIEDCRVGHEYGRIFLDRRQRFGAPLLTWIIRDMIRAGRFSGVEAGFLGVIAGALPRTETTSILLSVSNDNPSDRHSG